MLARLLLEMKPMSKAKAVKVTPSVESPTWGDVQRLAHRCLELLGGPGEAAIKLSACSFYTLCILDALNLDEAKSNAPIFGKRHLT